MLIFANRVYSQVCTNLVTKYHGPTNTTDLTALLNTTDSTTYPILVRLTSEVKTSLETYVWFENGYPVGMSGSDSNIAIINSHPTACAALFTEIFGLQDLVCTYTTKPTVTDISMAEFETLSGGGTLFSTIYSHCLNCLTPNPDGSGPAPGQCCSTGGPGCWDSMTDIGGTYYHVDTK